MRIAINTLGPSKIKVGIGNYITNLIEKLNKIDRQNKYIVFVNKNNARFFHSTSNFKLIVLGAYSQNRILRMLWEQLVLPFILFFNRVDVLFSPGFASPILKNTKQVLTIPDMTWYSHPGVHQKFKLFYYKIILPISARFADKIIAISHNTKKDILRYIRLNSSKIEVTHLAAHDRYCLLDQIGCKKKLKEKYKINSDFILYVGTLEPRKNILNIIKAYSLLKKKDCLLLIVGKKGWMYDKIFRIVKRLKLEDKVCFMGYVPDEDLPLFYNTAKLFVYPSFYEGFGIPVVEAMACGCPVITSNISSLPEVAGQAAMLVNPHSIDEISVNMKKILNNSSLQQKMIKKGLNQVKKFNWVLCAKQTLNIFENFRKKK